MSDTVEQLRPAEAAADEPSETAPMIDSSAGQIEGLPLTAEGREPEPAQSPQAAVLPPQSIAEPTAQAAAVETDEQAVGQVCAASTPCPRDSGGLSFLECWVAVSSFKKMFS